MTSEKTSLNEVASKRAKQLNETVAKIVKLFDETKHPLTKPENLEMLSEFYNFVQIYEANDNRYDYTAEDIVKLTSKENYWVIGELVNMSIKYGIASDILFDSIDILLTEMTPVTQQNLDQLNAAFKTAICEKAKMFAQLPATRAVVINQIKTLSEMNLKNPLAFKQTLAFLCGCDVNFINAPKEISPEIAELREMVKQLDNDVCFMAQQEKNLTVGPLIGEISYHYNKNKPRE